MREMRLTYMREEDKIVVKEEYESDVNEGEDETDEKVGKRRKHKNSN